MKLFIFANTTQESRIAAALRCITLLEKNCGAKCVMSAADSETMLGNGEYAGDAADCSMVVAVGGDGTVLRAAKLAAQHDIPVVGINTGRLGYLCALELAEMESAGPDIFDKLNVSERMLLSFQHDGRTCYALNDVVIAKGSFGTSVALQVLLAGEEYNFWRGDGVIIATPTGSTSYNMSAGGPVVDPAIDAVLLTPICPHLSAPRSTVIAPDCPVTVRLQPSPDNEARIYADGVEIGKLQSELTVSRSERRLKLLTGGNKLLKLHRQQIIINGGK